MHLEVNIVRLSDNPGQGSHAGKALQHAEQALNEQALLDELGCY